LVILCVLVPACGDEVVPPGPSKCTGALYDSCNDEHDCTSQNCRPFGSIQVCTMTCTDTCPNDEAGNTVPCTNLLCAPAVANSCSLQ
jgi:hypothetical protein